MHIFYCTGGKFKEVEKRSPDARRGGIRRWPSVRCIVVKQHSVELRVGASNGKRRMQL